VYWVHNHAHALAYVQCSHWLSYDTVSYDNHAYVLEDLHLASLCLQ